MISAPGGQYKFLCMFNKKPLYSWTSTWSQMQGMLSYQCGGACRKKQKENQEDLLAKANQETMRALKSTDGASAVTAGRKVSAVEAYRRVEDIPTSRELAVMVRMLSQIPHHLLSGTGCRGLRAQRPPHPALAVQKLPKYPMLC